MGWIIICFLTVGLFTTAYGYPTPVDFDGKLQRWPVTPENPIVLFAIDGNAEDIEEYGALIGEAAAKWSEVETSFIELVPAADDETEQILIKLKTSMAGENFSSGFAMLDEKDSRGRLKHCTIEVHVGVAVIVLAKTILHELGHCVGLGHSLIPEAIMSYELEKNDFALDTDDIAAVSRLYPTDGSDPKLPPGCGVGTNLAVGTPWGNILILLVGLLPALAGVRWRREMDGACAPSKKRRELPQ